MRKTTMIVILASSLFIVPLIGVSNFDITNGLNNMNVGVTQVAKKKEKEKDVTQEKIDEAKKKIEELDKSDKKKWFKKYKKIQEKYSKWVDPDETIYDYFSEKELNLLFQIVEAEVTGKDYFQSKINVASVIFNRLDNEEFPNDLISILTQKSQFSSYWDGRYKKVDVTETTILACEYAFQFGDSTDGALYFDSCNGSSWANKAREYIFNDSVGHSFYR